MTVACCRRTVTIRSTTLILWILDDFWMWHWYWIVGWNWASIEIWYVTNSETAFLWQPPFWAAIGR